MITPEPHGDPANCKPGGTWSIQEFESVATPPPPDAMATRRHGRKELGQQIWEEFLRTEAVRKKGSGGAEFN